MRLSSLINPLKVSAAVLLLASSVWAAPKYRILHAFTGGRDGGGLWSSLVRDKKGNLYGTTSGDGAYGGGTVFRLTQQANGKWAEIVLHNFIESKDGGGPFGGPTLDTAGKLYGTTSFGGAHGYGTVFELSDGSDGWTDNVLFSFPQPPTKYGCCPQASLVIDNSDNLYGTSGAAFELSPGADGWAMTVLHDFFGQHGDGYGPYAGVVLDPKGNVYGATEFGGNPQCPGGGCGIAYELQGMPDGKWKEIVLHKFGAFTGDGREPAEVTWAGAGTLYGITHQGGTHVCFAGCGTVYKLTRQSDGRWKETIVYDFRDGASGNGPGAGVIMDKKGTLYGTAFYGGSPQCGCGVVYKLSPSSNGKWKYTVLHTFTGNDGAQPAANLILDGKGNLYGTTATGGAGGAGVAFEITP